MSFTSRNYQWDEATQQYLPVSSEFGIRGSTGSTSNNTLLCPDLLRLADLGEADNWRGHLVRGFFRLLTWITGI